MSDEQLIKLTEALSDPVSQIFSVFILSFFAYSLLCLIRKDRISLSFRNAAPSILTSAGILGTFIGIFLGLLEFDVTDPNKSVPSLLDGLKIAFLTSILGISSAILFKIIASVVHVGVGSSGATADDINASIINIGKTISDGQKETLKEMQQIKNAVSADNESSLITQLQKLRTSVIDGNSDLNESIKNGFISQINEFKIFADKLAENNANALIEALAEVMRDFNAKINEQFGENFKHLNTAVGKLLTWQEQYKDQIENIVEQYQLALKGIDDSRVVLSDIADNARTIPPIMKTLSNIMTALDAQLKDMNAHLEAFDQLKSNAVNAFPEIESNLKNLTSGFKEAVDYTSLTINEAVDSLNATLESQNNTFDELQNGFKELHGKSSEAVTQLASNVENAIAESATKMASTIEMQSKSMNDMVNQLQNRYSQTIEETAKKMGSQIENVDKQMQEELTRAIEKMGSLLASLSNKFVKDYSPLADRLKAIVEIARKQ